ncbi:LysR family transcriptional regulator [Xanthomonas massiliensis]|uniref:LysR family transcriptional regulator n=1 Tax=Xanthomonas massiliensis TaxID=1720302 RepID=UPI000825FC5F|nr:LysR family transcriptional regulator [Xanthomonas massiliensis]
MDSLAGFNVFVQVAETGSFAAAGRLLGTSASAVGKRVSRLEERLGVRLFHRSTRSLALTAEGQLLLERSRRILGQIEEVEAELCSSAGAPRGRLRVGLPLISSLVLPVLSDFAAAYPQIQLDLDFSDRMVDVVEEGFDAVVRLGPPRDSRLVARHLGDFRLLLVASPDYLAQAGVPRQPADLAGHRCLHYRFPTSGRLEPWPLRWPEDQACALPVSMVCNNIESRLCFAERGQGITCVPDFSAAAALAAGRLRSVLEDCMDFCNSYHLLWPSGRHMAPKLRVFVDFMQQRMLRAGLRDCGGGGRGLPG